jgi:hypothetical protein
VTSVCDLADLYRFYRAGAGMLTGIYRDFTALRLRAVIGHATSFWTWRSLCIDHGLADTEAVDAMTGMVLALTRAGRPGRGR